MKKLRKKLSCLLLCLSVSAAYLPAVYASSEQNICGDDLIWSFDESSKVLTISGDGDMYDFNYQQTPWYSLREEIEAVEFDGDITALGTYAFSDCTALETITIPETVSYIGSVTFENCTNLTSANILSTTLDDFDGSIFNGCDKLTDLTVSDDCYNYKSIDGNVYTKNGGTLVAYLPGCRNEVFNIPEDTYAIGMDAFSNHHFIKQINIHENVSDISEAFVCSCPLLATIKVDKDNTYYTAVDNVLFTKDMKTLLCYAEAKPDTSYKIPDGVERIGNEAFFDTNVEEFEIPDSVCEIGYYAFAYGKWWYDNRDEINGTYIGNYLLEIPYNSQSFTVKSGTKVIASQACSWRGSLTEISLPGSIEHIGDCAFLDCGKLKTVTIPDKVKGIGYMAFSYCRELKSITIGKGVTSIGNSAFDGCNKLATVFYFGNEDAWNNISILFNNAPLTRAKRIYLSDNQTSASDNGSFAIAPKDVANNSTVILALYNGDTLVEVQSKKYIGSAVPFTTDATYTKAKVMVWSSFGSMNPICDAETVQ